MGEGLRTGRAKAEEASRPRQHEAEVGGHGASTGPTTRKPGGHQMGAGGAGEAAAPGSLKPVKGSADMGTG